MSKKNNVRVLLPCILAVIGPCVNLYRGDSLACLLVDGKLVGAVEEERFRRIKHWAGFEEVWYNSHLYFVSSGMEV